MFHLLIQAVWFIYQNAASVHETWGILVFFERVFYHSGEDRRQYINQVPYPRYLVLVPLCREYNACQGFDAFIALGKARYEQLDLDVTCCQPVLDTGVHLSIEISTDIYGEISFFMDAFYKYLVTLLLPISQGLKNDQGSC